MAVDRPAVGAAALLLVLVGAAASRPAHAAPLALSVDVGTGLGVARSTGTAAPATTLAFREDARLSLGGWWAVHPRVALRLELSASVERVELAVRGGVRVRLAAWATHGLVYAGADLGALAATLIGTVELGARLGVLWRFGCRSTGCWGGVYAELGVAGWVWPARAAFLDGRVGLMLSAPSFWR